MGIKHLWDTNTSVYFLQQHFPPKAEKFIDELLLMSAPTISVITEIELLCWKTASDEDDQLLKHFIKDCKVIELDDAIKHQTAEIRKEYRIKLPDAIIAATALVFTLELVTRDVNDFQKIKGLKIINPFDIN